MLYVTNLRVEISTTGLFWRLIPIARKGAIYSALFLLGDMGALGIDSVILGRNMFHFFTLMTLMESALLFLMGGALDVGGSLSFHKMMGHVSKSEKKWNADSHKIAQSRAVPIVLAGVVLFVLSFALAYPLN